MTASRIRPTLVSLSLLPLALLAGCGGGGGGGVAANVQSLEAPSQLTVVTAAEAAAPGAVVPTAVPASSDYSTDVPSVWVYDPSMEALDQINEILCYMGMTGYDLMLNQGPYLALVDEAKCKQGGQQDAASSDTGQSSAANAIEPALWTVQSQRSSNSAAQEVSIWVPEEDDDLGPGEIHARVVATEGVSAANPFGQFSMSYARVPDGGTEANAQMIGFLQTVDAGAGNIGFEFLQVFGDVETDPGSGNSADEVKVRVEMSSDQSSGFARIRRRTRWNFPPSGDSGIQVEEYLLAFDDDHVVRSKNGAPATCLSRTSFQESVWRYEVYDSTTGERVELDSGFSFQTPEGEWGWMGYWGMWLPDGIAATDGMNLTAVDPISGDESTYTLKLAPGKLIERAKQELALTEIVGQTFTWWEYNSEAGAYYQFLIEYSGGQFLKIASMLEGSGQFEDLLNPVPIDTSVEGYLGLWSESLGGEVSYVHGDSFVTVFAEEFVTSAHEMFAQQDDVPLFGFFDALDAGLTTAEVEQGDIFLPVAPDLANPHHYVFRKSDLTLYYDADGDGEGLVPVGLAVGQSAPTSGPNTWGLRSGPMLPHTIGLANIDETWSATPSYAYETGPNSWNQYAEAVDSQGVSVSNFDPPIDILYTHLTANDRNGSAAFDGTLLQLSYNGGADLHGIPHEGVDFDGDTQPDRWLPLLNLADGTTLSTSTNEYIVKGLEVERSLAEDPGQCGTLDPLSASGLSLPDVSDYAAPGIGTKPVVTDAPAVVDGELQGGSGASS